MHPFQHTSSKLRKLYTSIFLLSLLAVIITILLIQTHYKVSATGSFCNIDDYWNCDRVNKSIFAAIFNIPVSIFGFLYYSFIALLGYGLIKQWNWQKIMPLTLNWVNLITFIFTALSTVALLTFEYTILANLYIWVILRNLVFIFLFSWIYYFLRKNPHPSNKIIGFFLIFALFGVNFSLYLTDIEIFVLKAICIYCFSQQIIIAIISGLLLYTLRENQNELRKAHQSENKHQ